MLVVVCILAAGFFLGQAAGLQIEDYQTKRYYEPLTSAYGLDTDMSEEEWQENIDRLITQGVERVSMESQLYFPNSESSCQARINNSADNELGVRLTLIRNATNEILFQSDMIDPGHYIEEIHLETDLESGYYPCMAIWEFFSGEDDFYVGNSAQNVVVTVGS